MLTGLKTLYANLSTYGVWEKGKNSFSILGLENVKIIVGPSQQRYVNVAERRKAAELIERQIKAGPAGDPES